MNPFTLRDYQIEVLNKCEERKARDAHPCAGAFWILACKVPEIYINEALGKMQDKRMQNLDPQKDHTASLTAYYLAALKGICKDNGVRWPLGKGEE